MTNFISNHRSYDVRDINHTYSKYKSDISVHWTPFILKEEMLV